METSNEKNIATFIHLSSLSQYFIPFGNFIFPIIIWSSKKDTSEFVDHNGKQVINFQLSLLIYSLVCAMIAIPILLFTIFNNVPFNDFYDGHNLVINDFNFSDNTGIMTVGLIAAFIFLSMKIAEFFLIINAAIKTSNGDLYKYPFCISFLK